MRMRRNYAAQLCDATRTVPRSISIRRFLLRFQWRTAARLYKGGDRASPTVSIGRRKTNGRDPAILRPSPAVTGQLLSSSRSTAESRASREKRSRVESEQLVLYVRKSRAEAGSSYRRARRPDREREGQEKEHGNGSQGTRNEFHLCD